jgi:hypothetical protein
MRFAHSRRMSTTLPKTVFRNGLVGFAIGLLSALALHYGATALSNATPAAAASPR